MAGAEHHRGVDQAGDADFEDEGPSARARIRRDTVSTLRVVSRGGRRSPRSQRPSPSAVGMKAGYTTWTWTPLGHIRNEIESAKADRAAFEEG